MSDMEGKVTRVGASERGQRTSFKTPRIPGSTQLLETRIVINKISVADK